MNKKIAWVISSVCWIILITVPLIYYANQMCFPVIAYGKVSKIVLLIAILLPLIFFIVSRLVRQEKAVFFLFCICIVLNLLSTFSLTLFFTADEPLFYPVASYTEEPQNYLIIDENLQLYTDEDDYIFTVFPKAIPEGAENIKYFYYCETASDSLRINAKWSLTVDEFAREKERILDAYLSNENNSTFNFGSEHFDLIVEFDEQNNLVSYSYEQGDFVPEEHKKTGDGSLS